MQLRAHWHRLRHDRIASKRDPLRPVVIAAALALFATAMVVRRSGLLPAMGRTAEPFATLAAVIAVGMAADRAGVLGWLARALIPDRGSASMTAGAVLGFAAVLSALVNLDVAAVVAMPVALRVADRRGLSATWLAVAVALTANATSFLLPTSNVTNLLVLSRDPLAAGDYVRGSWLAWAIVAVLTVAVLARWVAARSRTTTPGGLASGPTTGPTPAMLLELIPMFLAAASIRALLGSGLALHGSFARQAILSSVIGAGVDNLPAASAISAAGATARWAAVLALSAGANLVLWGSVATLICRRSALDAGARFPPLLLTGFGLALLPMQLAAAFVGLRATGAL